jgi:hypothetical protein
LKRVPPRHRAVGSVQPSGSSQSRRSHPGKADDLDECMRGGARHRKPALDFGTNAVRPRVPSTRSQAEGRPEPESSHPTLDSPRRRGNAEGQGGAPPRRPQTRSHRHPLAPTAACRDHPCHHRPPQPPLICRRLPLTARGIDFARSSRRGARSS